MIFSRRNLYSFAVRLLGSAGLLLSASVQAAAAWSANSMTINSLIADPTDTTLVVTGNDNSMGCTVSNWARISSTDANYALISAELLSAFAQGKPVKLYEYACATDGTVKFNSVWVDR